MATAKKAAAKKPATPVSKKGNETTSTSMATLAAKTLNDPKATVREKKLAGALLNQAPDRAKK